MRRVHRYLLLLWLAAESSLAGLGFFVLAKSLFTAEILPKNQVTATVVCMLLLCVVFGSLWSHARAEKPGHRISAEPK